MSPQPTIVLISGGCHPSSCWDTLLPHLRDLSYPTLSLQLPSLNHPKPLEATSAGDTQGIRDRLLSLLDDGKDVVVVPHSMAGIVTAGALQGLGRTARAAEGKKGGVVGAIWLAAALIPGGLIPIDLLGQAPGQPKMNPNTPFEGLFTLRDVNQDFFYDVPSPLAEQLEASLEPHAVHALETPVVASALGEPDFVGKIAYIKTMQDRALPVAAQEMAVQMSGFKWIVRELETGHSPFASHPVELAKMVDELVKGFVEKKTGKAWGAGGLGK